MGLPIGQGCPPLHAHARRAGPSRSCNRSTGMACLFCRQPKCCLQNKQFRRKKISTGTPPAARVISPLHNLWASPQAKIPRSFRALFWDRAAQLRLPLFLDRAAQLRLPPTGKQEFCFTLRCPAVRMGTDLPP